MFKVVAGIFNHRIYISKCKMLNLKWFIHKWHWYDYIIEANCECSETQTKLPFIKTWHYLEMGKKKTKNKQNTSIFD